MDIILTLIEYLKRDNYNLILSKNTKNSAKNHRSMQINERFTVFREFHELQPWSVLDKWKNRGSVALVLTFYVIIPNLSSLPSVYAAFYNRRMMKLTEMTEKSLIVRIRISRRIRNSQEKVSILHSTRNVARNGRVHWFREIPSIT